MMCAYFYGCNMLTTLLLLFGYTTTTQEVDHIEGMCRGISEAPVPCVMQEHPFGVKYITDYNTVYKLRPVFWGGHYTIRTQTGEYASDVCIMRDKDIYCKRTLIFIQNENNPSNGSNTSFLNPSTFRGIGESRQWRFA